MEEKLALSSFAALSNETRLRILRLLVQAGEQGLLAGDIAQHIGATPSRTSFHLSTLAETGLATATREARQITYRIDFEAIGGLVRYLLEDCCQNNKTVRSCCQKN